MLSVPQTVFPPVYYNRSKHWSIDFKVPVFGTLLFTVGLDAVEEYRITEVRLWWKFAERGIGQRRGPSLQGSTAEARATIPLAIRPYTQ
jgi:hypothetical protein